jgi:AcrR family transcriptional regulator
LKHVPVQPRERPIKRLILDAALDLFTANGYFNTSVHHIQKTAGISIGSIYHHFNNKESIAKAIYEELIDQMSHAILRIMQAHESTKDRCRGVIFYLFEMAEQEPEKMDYMLHVNHKEFIPDQKPVCSSLPFELVAGMIPHGMDAGEIRAMDPIAASACIFGPALRLIHLKLDGVLTKPLAAYLDEIWSAVWQGVAGE